MALRVGHAGKIPAPREAAGVANTVDTAGETPSRRRPLAVLSVRIGGEGECSIESELAAIAATIAAAAPPHLGPYWSEGQVILAYDNVADAGATALALAAAGKRCGGHYLAATTFNDPFATAERLPVDAIAAAAAASVSTPQRSACVTDDFATALGVAASAAPGSEYVGELDPPDDGPPVGLYALKPRTTF